MKKEITPRIERAIDVFLDALNDGTLVKGTCSACAVANLVAKGMGRDINIRTVGRGFDMDDPNAQWMLILDESTTNAHKNIAWALQEGRKGVESTDFSINELILIEEAFESEAVLFYYYYDLYPIERVRQDQINGLEAVVKVMMTFDDVKQDVEEVFTNKAKELQL